MEDELRMMGFCRQIDDSMLQCETLINSINVDIKKKYELLDLSYLKLKSLDDRMNMLIDSISEMNVKNPNFNPNAGFKFGVNPMYNQYETFNNEI